MSKHKLLLIASVILIEVLIFFWANYLSDNEQLYFQLAARYSARFSFLLFAGILYWIGKTGLVHIFSIDASRNNFVFLLSLFTLNHLIHFYFLFMNFKVNGLLLFETSNMAGALGYVVLIIWPLVLWKKTNLTPFLYWGTNASLFFLWIIFAVSYAKRLFKEYPYPPSTPIIILSLLLLFGLIIFCFYRIIKEVKSSKVTEN